LINDHSPLLKNQLMLRDLYSFSTQEDYSNYLISYALMANWRFHKQKFLTLHISYWTVEWSSCLNLLNQHSILLTSCGIMNWRQVDSTHHLFVSSLILLLLQTTKTETHLLTILLYTIYRLFLWFIIMVLPLCHKINN
jgi:hypothetical protein